LFFIIKFKYNPAYSIGMQKDEFDFPEEEPELQKDFEDIEKAPEKSDNSKKELEEELKEMKKKVQ